MIKAKVSFHGHSTYSDGLDSVEKLVKKAAELNFDYFGISDHNTTDHINPFYQAIEAINLNNEYKIIPICAVEIALWHKGKRTDTLFAKPGDLDQDFLRWIESIIQDRAKTLDIVPIIEKAISDFNALVVIPHPGMPYAPSATFDLLNELSSNLSDRVKKNLGVEIRNWNSNIFPNNKKREEKVAVLAKEFGFATFGLADYHAASDLKYMFSFAGVENKTAQDLIQAVHNRRIYPARLNSANKLELIKIGSTISKAVVRVQFLSQVKKDRMNK